MAEPPAAGAATEDADPAPLPKRTRQDCMGARAIAPVLVDASAAAPVAAADPLWNFDALGLTGTELTALVAAHARRALVTSAEVPMASLQAAAQLAGEQGMEHQQAVLHAHIAAQRAGQGSADGVGVLPTPVPPDEVEEELM